MKIMSLVVAGAATLSLAVASAAEAQVIRDHRGGYQPYKGHGTSPTAKHWASTWVASTSAAAHCRSGWHVSRS